jgi:acetyltransferase-like isoleucine patch superfamily enzyme
MIKTIIRTLAMRYGIFPNIYKKICKSGKEYADFLRLHGKFQSIGENCSILLGTNFTDPSYVRIGNNVHFSDCAIIGHDGSIAMLNIAYNTKLDAVGKIDIKDNVFIGYHAIVLPNVTIGPNSIVAAGAVVTKDVKEGEIVAGVPAKCIGQVENLVSKLQAETEKLPWYDLIQARNETYDPEMEKLLVQMRVDYFYKDST